MRNKTEISKVWDDGFYKGCVVTLIISLVAWVAIIGIIEWFRMY